MTPPVHPNCRCQIVDDVWYDAQDARVCPTCMLLGASWNIRLDVPIDPEEIGRLLDQRTLDDFKRAVAADSTLADRVIVQAGQSLESGVLKGVTPIQGEPMHVTVEREIVKARAAARARAPVLMGKLVPGFGAAPDALVFETTPIGKKATLVSVNVATGAGYRVIWRGGKYLLQTVGGRTLDSSGDLWWLLLLLALLEKKRRDEEERRKAEEAGQREA